MINYVLIVYLMINNAQKINVEKTFGSGQGDSGVSVGLRFCCDGCRMQNVRE